MYIISIYLKLLSLIQANRFQEENWIKNWVKLAFSLDTLLWR